MSCSAACLARHQQSQHPEQAGLGAAARAAAFTGSVNGKFPDNWERFAPHRHRLMQLVEAAGASGKLAVFGAGNAADLELPWLLERFDEVHLVDLDGAALERARVRHKVDTNRLVLRPETDLSGMLEHLDDWGESFPDPAELGRAAVQAAGQLSSRLGKFDVTLSTCVLSQLGLPFRRAWVASRTTWGHLMSAITSVHLATLAGTTARSSILVADVATSQRLPALDELRGARVAELEAFVTRHRDAGSLSLQPDPRRLLAWLSAPGLSRLVAEPRVSSPWLWDLGDVRQLVYALTFHHPRIMQ
jgi:hypothetical protein